MVLTLKVTIRPPILTSIKKPCQFRRSWSACHHSSPRNRSDQPYHFSSHRQGGLAVKLLFIAFRLTNVDEFWTSSIHDNHDLPSWATDGLWNSSSHSVFVFGCLPKTWIEDHSALQFRSLKCPPGQAVPLNSHILPLLHVHRKIKSNKHNQNMCDPTVTAEFRHRRSCAHRFELQWSFQ